MDPVTSRRRARLVCCLAVVLTTVLYGITLRNPFIYDDYRVIVENRAMTAHAGLGAIIGADVTRPVATISYAIDRAWWGRGATGFHFTNLLLHIINVVLVALLAWRIADDRRQRGSPGAAAMRPDIVSGVAALLFAVHPLLSGAVGYISARPELLSATFIMVALLCARRWMKMGRGLWLMATFVFWILALGTKETAALFPVLVLAYDRLILAPTDRSESRRRLIRLHAPLIGLATVLVAARVAVFVFVEQGGAVDFQWRLALVELDVVRRYATMLIVPAGQSIYHAVAPISGGLELRTLVSIGLAGIAAWLIWKLRRSNPIDSLGLLWFLAFLLPSSVLVTLNRAEPMAEHRVYLASCGVFLIAGAVADRAWAVVSSAQRATRIVLVGGFIAIVITLSGRTFLRNTLWERPVLVWLEAAERAPNDWLPHRVLGEELHRSGKHAEAIAAFSRAVELGPAELSAYGKLGVCLSELGDLDAAHAAFTKMQALEMRSPEASNGLATVALLRGQLDVARRGYEQALAFDSRNVAARRGLAVIEESPGGSPKEALRLCREIKSIEPDAEGIDACIARNAAKLGGGRDNQR